jgi:hypothetical protein
VGFVHGIRVVKAVDNIIWIVRLQGLVLLGRATAAISPPDEVLEVRVVCCMALLL